jgi:cytochrome c oxidase assembly protein subunit 15
MNKGLRRYSLLVTGATFCLIIAGALVTSNDAGLATSDWPRSNGQWFPRMVGNLFWEHGHRMVATTVGFLTIGLLIYLYVAERRRWVRRLGVVALAGVVAQGLLGGLTVKLMLPLVVSAAHATLAQLFFCTVVSISVFTSRGWHERWAAQGNAGGTRISYLCIAAVVTIFLQLILGATLRHSATWDHELPIQLVLAHIGGALTVAIVLGRAAITVLRRHSAEKYLTTPAKLALLLLGGQLLLGVTAYLTRRASTHQAQPLNPMIGITVAHVACGALVFATTIVLTLRSFAVGRAQPSGLATTN